MFGFPWNLIAAGIGFLVISGAVWGVIHTHDNKVKVAALAPWKPLTEKCEASKRTPAECAKEWTDAVAYNVSLQGDVSRLETAAGKCSAETKKGADLTAQAEADKARRLGRTEGYREGLVQSKAEAEKRLAASAGPAKTCEQTLTAVGESLGNVAMRRIRFALGFDDQPLPADDGVKIK